MAALIIQSTATGLLGGNFRDIHPVWSKKQKLSGYLPYLIFCDKGHPKEMGGRE